MWNSLEKAGTCSAELSCNLLSWLSSYLSSHTGNRYTKEKDSLESSSQHIPRGWSLDSSPFLGRTDQALLLLLWCSLGGHISLPPLTLGIESLVQVTQHVL